MQEKIYQIVIIGGGAAGVMASLRAVLNNDEVLFFPGSTKNKKKSRDFWVKRVENMPGFHTYEKAIEHPNKSTLEWIESSDFKNRFTNMQNRGVEHIVKMPEGYFKITDSMGANYKAEFVVICTGIMDIQPNIAGSIKPIFPYANAQTVDYCLRCDGHHTIAKDTAVIGNGKGAAWVAIMLVERYQLPSMTILTNGEEPNFDEDVQVLIKLYKIKIISEEIIEILGDTKRGELQGFKTQSGQDITAQFAFISLGTMVYNQLAVTLGAAVDNRGYVISNEKGMTNIDNVYVAGDIRAGLKKQIYTAWDSAVDALDDINSKIRLEKRKKLLF